MTTLRALGGTALALLFVACSDGGRIVEPFADAGADGGAASDLPAPTSDLCCGAPDAMTPNDLAPPADVAPGPDLAVNPDQASLADLTLLVDGALGPDLVSPSDLAVASDPVRGIDLPALPDLAGAVADSAAPRDLAAAPDLAPTCQPGHYSGMVTANVMGLALTGPIELDVAASANGLLPVTGTIRGAAQGATAMADVQGTLDCNARRFAGTLKNGTVTAMGITLALTGSLAADYRLAPPGFINGTVTLVAPAMGQGAWSAARQ